MAEGVDLIIGTIDDVATDERIDIEHLMFLNDAAIYTVVQVVNVESYIYETNMEIQADCKAIDSVGLVGRVEMVFNPDNKAEMDAILKDVAINKVFAVKGPFGWPVDNVVSIHDPEYIELSHEESDKIREVIITNGKNA